jgi:hypothetical protein
MPELSSGRLDEAKCREWIRANVRVQSGLRGHGGRVAAGEAVVAPDTGPSLTEAKRIRATFDALLSEHRRDRLLDSLAPVEPTVVAVAEELDEIRARFREVPPWLAPKLMDVSDAPIAAKMILRAFRGALHDISREDGEPPWDGNLADAPLPVASTQVYVVTCDGEVKYSHRPKEVEPPVAEPKKKKRRRRSTPAVEAAIAETGAEDDVDNDLIYAVERAIPTMTLIEARTRREIAEGDLKRCEYDLLQRTVVRLDAVEAALSANFNGVKTNVLGIASKVAPRITLLSDAKLIERAIAKELNEVLEDLADAKTLVGKCLWTQDWKTSAATCELRGWR